MRVLLGAVLILGALMGVPMDPEKMREMMALSSRSKQEQVVPERPDDENMEEYLKRRGLRRGDEIEE